MNIEKQYLKNDAIKEAEKFLSEIRKIEEKYSFQFNADSGVFYLTYKTVEGELDQTQPYWGSVAIGWSGNGSGLKVTEIVKDNEYYKQQALSKLSDEEKKALGL